MNDTPAGEDSLRALESLGVELDTRAYLKATGKTINPGDVALLNELPADSWGVEFAPTWPLLNPTDPRYAALAAVMARFDADPGFRALLSDAYDRRVEAWVERQLRRHRWGTE